MSDEEITFGLSREPEVGDYVAVWGVVVNTSPHPEEYSVRFRSHNEDYVGLVRRTETIVPDEQPAFAVKCAALKKVTGEPYLVRCRRNAGHDKEVRHVSVNGVEWADKKTTGYIEEA